MKVALKWLGWGILALVVLAAAGAGAGYVWLRGSLPVIDGQRSAPGLAAAVEIVRDRHGVPHLLAGSEDDALFALGFVHAQDRLWQMEMNRRIGAGRLAEVLGPAALDLDRLTRGLGLYRRAAAAFDYFEPESQRRIEAYVAGVNAWLQTRQGPLPPEFLIAGFDPEPWTAADTLVWSKVMALDLGREWRRDLMRLRLSERLAPDRMRDFYTPYRPDKPHGVVPAPEPSGAIPEHAGTPSDAQSLLEPAGPLAGPRDDSLRGRGPAPSLVTEDAAAPALFAGFLRRGQPGSNAWAVDGTRSVTGKPLLANDPHIGLTVPSAWYFVHLSWPGRDVVGATFPGVPAVVLGHNGRAAWGFTHAGVDTQDVYIEKLDPDHPGRYLTPAGYRRFDVRREVIRVKGGEEVVLDVRETRHGPVLDDLTASAALASPAGHVLALSWTALRDDDPTLQAGLGFPHARDWADFAENLRDFHSPPQSIAYADTAGNIGFLVPGRVPRRAATRRAATRGEREDRGAAGGPGTMPRPGWVADHDWQGFIPFEELPRVHNPPGGAIVSANHRIVPADYPHHLTFEWAAGFRAERIMARLAARHRHDVESFRALQQDRVSLFARALLPRLRGVALDPDADPLAARARRLLDEWNGDMDPERPEPLVFHAWLREFARLVAADELGSLQRAAWGRKGTFLQRILEEREIWCDGVATTRKETCDEMLSRSLVRAVHWIADRHGGSPADWRWGRAHVALGEHRPFAASPLARIFNLPGPAPGATYTVNAFDFNPLDDARPFASTHGPSLRAVYDLADLDRSLFIHSTGQSGNVLSPLYRNFEPRWRNGEYVTIPTRREAFEAGALGRLVLVPR